MEPRDSGSPSRSTVSDEAAQYDHEATKTARLRLAPHNDNVQELHDSEIRLRIAAVAHSEPNDPMLVQRRLLVADTVMERYQTREQDPRDLDLAITMVDEITSIDKNHPLFPDYLRQYGLAHLLRSETGAHKCDLDKAIEKLEVCQLLRGLPAEVLQLQSALLLRRFRATSDSRDLQKGLGQARKVLGIGDVSTITQAYALSNLIECQHYLYELQMRDWRQSHDEAVDLGLKAIELVRSGIGLPNIAFVFGALALAYYKRFEQRRDAEDLENAISNGREALHRCETNDPDRPGWMSNHGLAHKEKFLLSGHLPTLLTAIQLLDKAVSLSPKDSAREFRCLNNLADALVIRFDWTGETEALDIAVSKYRSMAKARNGSAIEWATSLRNLATTLRQAYDRQPRREFLDEAVQVVEEALSKFPNGHVEVASTHALFSSILSHRYVAFKQEEDIIAAIAHGKDSLRVLSHIESDPYILNVLSRTYKAKWLVTRAKFDLEAALSYATQCYETTPETLPDGEQYLLNYGDLLIADIFERNDKPDHSTLNRPLEIYRQIVNLSMGKPLIRIIAARKALRILGELGRWSEAKSVGLTALGLLPMICGRYLALQDQQHAIAQTSGLAADVCSLLLQIGEPEEALRQLEAGRAMLLGFAMNDNNEVSALPPELARTFRDTMVRLRDPAGLQSTSPGESRLRDRRAAEVDFYDCLNKIRSTEGHHEFLHELSIARIKECSKEGPIVIVNISYIRSDAIIVVDSTIRAISLPNLDIEKVNDFGLQLISNFSFIDFPVNRAIKVLSREIPHQPAQSSFTEWLWHSCVKHVFAELNIRNAFSKNRELTRIWWIGSGGAAGFPFHAASAGSGPEQDALSLIIPSYTPSIKALFHARQHSIRYRDLRQVHNRAKPKMAFISMESTPGHDDLPAVRKEKETVMKLVKSRWSFADLSQPAMEMALEAIAKSDIIHIACHGFADRSDPSQSHLLLQKQTKNGSAVDKLTVSQMLALGSLPNAWLSFLSACSTATMGTFRLGDEGLHISGALQVAGYAHAVGSLWKVEDRFAVDLAREFYTRLLSIGDRLNSDRAVAESLREAVLFVRQQNPSDWTKWAAYIHSGA